MYKFINYLNSLYFFFLLNQFFCLFILFPRHSEFLKLIAIRKDYLEFMEHFNSKLLI